ncbi:MAG: ABC transporter substrate-binding protein [Acidimicrobiales bacterium]
MRIVSLLPSATEIVYRLGLGESLVGVTFECDEPLEARARHEIVVGGLPTHGLSAGEIDALVRAKVAAGEPLYVLDEAAIGRLQPDVILTQDLCRVCALPAGDVDEALGRLGCRADVVTLDPHTLDGVLATITEIGARCGAPQAAAREVAALRARLDAVAAATAGRPRPRVFVLEWTDPPFLAGHWVPDLVVAAGGEPVLARAGARSVPGTWDAIAAAGADVVVVAPCGFGLADAVAQAEGALDRLPAGVPVWAIDANAFTVRPGPRLVDGVEALAAAFHPDAVPPPPPGRISAIRQRIAE